MQSNKPTLRQEGKPVYFLPPSFFICSQGPNKHRQHSARGSDTFPTGHCTVSESEGEFRGVHGSRITMKTTRVLVLLLLVSVHVVRTDSSEQVAGLPVLNNKTDSTAQSGVAQNSTQAQPTQSPVTNLTEHLNTTAPITMELTSSAAAVTVTKAMTTAPSTVSHTQNQTLSNGSLDRKSSQTLNLTTTSKPMMVTQPHPVPKNDTVVPRSFQTPKPSAHSETKKNETSADQGHIAQSNPDKGPSTPAPGETETKKENNDKKGAGSQTGSDETEPPKSDKRLWWILLPVFLVGAAAAIILRFRSKKINSNSETIDTGTENASFQSRPESSKDGVMLLGVKSSGGDENAAAR
nr:PREDICTED: uncharacterized protein LOC109634707 [Paralichthys olivaceus]